MKRIDLVRFLDEQGCVFMREGGNHSVYLNPELHRTSTVPRHREINQNLVRKICRDLGIPQPK